MINYVIKFVGGNLYLCVVDPNKLDTYCMELKYNLRNLGVLLGTPLPNLLRQTSEILSI